MTHLQTANLAGGGGLTKAQKIRSIIAASSGNLVEWFDFYIYAFTAVFCAQFLKL